MKKLLVILLALSATSLFAEEFPFKNTPGSDDSSGCGYGWSVTKERTISASSTRASTNSTASNTIAMTMGTSGCEKHSIVKADKQQEFYTEINYENILAEMAQGQGEYLTAFAGVMGCSNVEAFANYTQANLENIAASSPMALLNNVRSEIASNSSICL